MVLTWREDEFAKELSGFSMFDTRSYILTIPSHSVVQFIYDNF